MAATTTEEAAGSPWPAPIPNDWKEARKVKAQEWFEKARDDKLRCFKDAEVQAQLAQQAAAVAARAQSQQGQQVQAFKQLQASTRAAATALIRSRAAATALARTPPEHLLRFPHHTALRPVMILDAAQPDVNFPEQLLVRGVVSTLLANMQVPSTDDTDAPAWVEQSVRSVSAGPSDSSEHTALPHSLRGFSELLQPGCGGTDVLWWGPLQPSGTCDDLGLARLELLWRCRVCVLILSNSLVNGPSWPDDRQVLAARLLGQADDEDHPLSLLVVRMPSSPHSPPPDLQVPQPPAGATTTTRVTQVHIPATASHQDQVKLVIEALRPMLQQTLGVYLPPVTSTCEGEATFTVSFTPAAAIRDATRLGYIYQPGSCLRNSMARLGCAAVAGAGSSSQGLKPRASVTSLTGLNCSPRQMTSGSVQSALPTEQATGVLAGVLERTGPSMGATQDPGQMEYGESWVVAHSLGSSAASKPLGLWCIDDVDAWVRQTCGAAASAAAPVLMQYGVDGQLLQVMQPQHLAGLLGELPWLKMLTHAITQLQQCHSSTASNSNLTSPRGSNARTASQVQLNNGAGGLSQSLLSTSGVWRPGVAPGADDPFLITSSVPQLEQKFLEAVRFYDVDCTGDLDALEMHKLLTACGVDLSTAEAAQVLKEYDRDKDGKLCREECLDVMWDIGRLMLASRDCTAWNVPCMTATGNSSTLRRHLLLLATRHHTDTALSQDQELGAAMPMVDTGGLGGQAQSKWETASGKSSVRTHASSRRGTSVSMSPGTAASRLQHMAQSTAADHKRPAQNKPASVQSQQPVVVSTQPEEEKGQPVRRRPPKRGVSFAKLQAQHQDETARTTAGEGDSTSDLQSPPSRAAAGGKSAGLNQATLRALGAASKASPWAGARSRHASMAGNGLCDDDGEELVGNDGVSCCSSKRAATVATDLDVFADPLLLVSTTQLRNTLDPDTLAMSLKTCLTAADLQRRGALAPAALRSALTTKLANESCLAGGGASLRDTLSSAISPRSCTAHRRSCGDVNDMEPATLSPAELQLVACAILEQQQQQATNNTGRSNEGIAIDQFVTAAVQAVAESQQLLVDVVYGDNGTQRLLASLHCQKYPGSSHINGSTSACSTTLLGGGVHQAQASTSAVASITSSALASTKVPFEAAPALLDVVIGKQQLQGAVPLLVRVALLQEAAAAGERCAGSGNEVDAWSATAAHMLHVWSKLRHAQNQAASVNP